MGTMEGLVGEFKYEVGDEFTYDGDLRRKIVARYKSAKGENRYVVSYGEVASEVILEEWYITEHYKKIEPFFEEGKKYQYPGDGECAWTCHVVTEVLGKKIALMTYGNKKDPAQFEQHEFRHYREVK